MKIWTVVFCLLSSVGFSNERIIVKLKNSSESASLFKDLKVQKLFGTMYVLKADEALIKKLKNSEAVDYVQRDGRSYKQKLPKVELLEPAISVRSEGGYFNDPKVGRKWSFKDSEDHGVSVSKTYEELGPSTGETIIVAVVDTGVDYKHEDLKDVMWVNEDEIPANGIDDDGNGYIDDIHGINTLVRDNDGKATVDMMDGHSHGTHVSGIIGATQNNNRGVAGVASKVKIMGIRTVPNYSDETDVDVIEAFLYAARNGAKIINCSFGKRENEGGQAVNDTINHIGKKYGVLVIAASGNDYKNIDNSPTYPASFDSDYLFVIASTTKLGSYSSFSNYGRKSVDIAAPGSSIYSTIPGGKYGSMSGTSMASPTAAGVAAEVLSRSSSLGPLELKKILMDTSVRIRRRIVKKTKTNGRIDLYNSLTN